MRHDGFDIDRLHPLFDRALHAQQTDAVLVLHQLTDRANAAVAKIINVVDLANTVLQLHQRIDNSENIFLAQNPHFRIGIQLHTQVHLHPAHIGQVITLLIKEERVEEVFRRFGRGRLARTHNAVNID